MNIILASVFIFTSVFSPLSPIVNNDPNIEIDDLSAPFNDSNNLIDTANTLSALETTLGYEPTIEELFFIIIQAQEMGTESQLAIADSYFSYCRTSPCATASLLRFLSNYDIWFDIDGIIDVKSDIRALEFYLTLMDGKVSRDILYDRIDTLLEITARTENVLDPISLSTKTRTLDGIPNFLVDDAPDSPPQPSYDGLNAEIDLIPLGTEDLGDLIDVERTYNELVRLMGRKPTIEEILYMTIWSEYWLIVKSDTSRIGQDAIARSYYHFCGLDSCDHEELIKFLSGYQPWFDRPGYVDVDTIKQAEHLHMLLTHEFNYNCCGEFLYEQIDEILKLELAIEKRWTDGKTWQRASQWYGPAGPPPKGSSFGYGSNDYAIKAIKYPGKSDTYFYFLTWEQEHSFTPMPIP